jgi:hypothetical protein
MPWALRGAGISIPRVDVPDEQLRLVDGLQRAFDAFITRPDPEPVPASAGRRRSLRPAPKPVLRPGQPLADLIRAELGDWKEAVRAAARANGDTRRLQQLEDAQGLEDILPVHRVQGLLQPQMDRLDTAVLARRIAGDMAGPPAALWQYIAVNVVPAFPLDLLDGWELAPIDTVHDEKTPLWYPGRTPFNPAYFHFENDYGAIRRLSGEHDAPPEESDSSGPVLLWPLITLNLYSDYPVHAGISYYVEQGRRVAPQPRVGQQPPSRMFIPKELREWDNTEDEWVRPRKGRIIDARASDRLGMFASEFGSRLGRLDKRHQARFARAADQYLIVVHRTPGRAGNAPTVPSMHASEAAFRWISAIEGLLADRDDRSDLKRKTAQRAAILAGQDDSDRLAVRDLVNAAYGVRSAYAHGSQPETIDLAALRSLARRVMVTWAVLAAEYPGVALPGILDDALLSQQLLDGSVQQPIRWFLNQAAPEE